MGARPVEFNPVEDRDVEARVLRFWRDVFCGSTESELRSKEVFMAFALHSLAAWGGSPTTWSFASLVRGSNPGFLGRAGALLTSSSAVVTRNQELLGGNYVKE